jgi:enoyl-CoA hydratase
MHMSANERQVAVRLEERQGGAVAFVTIDNPARLNSMNSPLMEAFVECLSELAQKPELRGVVLTGAGEKAFIGGADIKEMSAFAAPADARRFITRVHRCCNALRQLPVPVIARINGLTFGAGMEMAAACDVRIAADTAVFGMPEVRLGIPSVVEAALLPMLIGWGRTRQLLLFGENISASEALDWGFLERIAPAGKLDHAVGEWLEQILACKPGAVRLQKRLIGTWEDLPLRAAIEAGIDSFEAAYGAEEPAQAMREFLEKQKIRKANK